MTLSDAEFETIISYITKTTGIVPRESHRAGIKRYIETRLNQLEEKGMLKTVVNKASFFTTLFSQKKEELINLINKATVNETYFFREERQLDMLKTTILPKIHKKYGTVHIWSAATSSGEEIYTLALLAKACHIPVTLIASDINTNVLDKCRSGIYETNSIRQVDGTKYHYLLEPYKQNDGTYKIGDTIKQMVDIRQLNLLDVTQQTIPLQFPTKQHIIFIRNVFIYFNREMRGKILKGLTTHCLADDGYLFVSMNEVASFDPEIMPPELEKVFDGGVFYFHKQVK